MKVHRTGLVLLIVWPCGGILPGGENAADRRGEGARAPRPAC